MDFLKQKDPICIERTCSFLPKRARRSNRPRGRVRDCGSPIARSEPILHTPPKIASFNEYSSGSESFSDSAMDSPDSSSSEEPPRDVSGSFPWVVG